LGIRKIVRINLNVVIDEIVYELGRLFFDAKETGSPEKIRSTSGSYYLATYILQIQYGRRKIKLSVPLSGKEIEVDYLKRSDHQSAVDEPYGSDYEREDDSDSDNDSD
jgi:hypothetical protein